MPALVSGQLDEGRAPAQVRSKASSPARRTAIVYYQGAYCWDVDGNKYIDYVGSWGPAIVGAANDEVRQPAAPAGLFGTEGMALTAVMPQARRRAYSAAGTAAKLA